MLVNLLRLLLFYFIFLFIRRIYIAWRSGELTAINEIRKQILKNGKNMKNSGHQKSTQRKSQSKSSPDDITDVDYRIISKED